jgi:aminopeptidase-like protein
MKHREDDDASAAGSALGKLMLRWAKDLYPICRSITGPGLRTSLEYFKRLIPEMTLHEVATGTTVFDWAIPEEWSIDDAYIEDESGNRIVDFKASNLHVVNYSTPVDQWMTLTELEAHLHSMPDKPLAIPYVTSYYARRWGFCIAHRQRQLLKPGRYHAVIRSMHYPGHLSYGEVLLPGREEREVFLSTYLCHPSMANNELSGPVVTAALCRWLNTLKERRYSYRIVFVPETIGSITYLSRNLERMKTRILAGFVLSCVGDERAYSMIASRSGATLADRVLAGVLTARDPGFKRYSFLERGSDERQYCSPGADLPVVGFCRSKYGVYPEYHTSLDDFDLVTANGLYGSFEAMKACLGALERDHRYRPAMPCEPQLGKRGLYPSLSTPESGAAVRGMMNVLAYADGTHDAAEIAERTALSVETVHRVLKTLADAGVIH